MDGSTFDRLTRAISTAGSRRRLLGLLTSVGLGGLLTQLDNEATDAKRKHGRHRGHHPGQGKRRRKRKRKNNGGKGGKGGSNPGACTGNGGGCNQNSDCCAENCFNQACAATVSQCGTVACPAGATGCCPVDGCCASPANQCNAAELCCAPARRSATRRAVPLAVVRTARAAPISRAVRGLVAPAVRAAVIRRRAARPATRSDNAVRRAWPALPAIPSSLLRGHVLYAGRALLWPP